MERDTDDVSADAGCNRIPLRNLCNSIFVLFNDLKHYLRSEILVISDLFCVFVNLTFKKKKGNLYIEFCSEGGMMCEDRKVSDYRNDMCSM